MKSAMRHICFCSDFVYDGSLAVAYFLTPNRQLTRNSSTGAYSTQYNIPDHLGNVRSVVSSSGTVLQSTDYYPFGLAFADADIASNRYLYNGKELEDYTLGTSYLGTLDYGARHYDPRIARWTAPDPMAEKYYGVNAYGYCAGNPVNHIDPTGMDDYRYDDETGQFFLMQLTNEKTDRVLGYHLNKESGEYEQNTKWYQVKTRIEGIEKGILKDGINFKENDVVISVGRTGEPSVEGVESFVIELSEMVGLEIGGFEYSPKGATAIRNVYIGRYQSSKDNPRRWNTDRKAHATFDYKVSGIKPSDVVFYADFHTHLSKFSLNDRLHPSGSLNGDGDIGHKRNQQGYGIKKFIILTSGYPPIEY